MDWNYLLISTIFGFISGMLSFVLGMWIFNKYYLPSLMGDMATKTVRNLAKDPDVKPFIDKTKIIIEKLLPIVEQFKTLDLNGFQNDFKPLVEAVKNIDPNTLNDLVKSMKNFAKKLEKPEIPEPD